MSKYKVWIILPHDVEVDANSEDEAKELVLKQLLQTRQVKPTDLIELKAVKL